MSGSTHPESDIRNFRKRYAFLVNENVRSFNISPLNILIHKKKTHLTIKVGNNSVTKVAFIAVCKAGFQVQR